MSNCQNCIGKAFGSSETGRKPLNYRITTAESEELAHFDYGIITALSSTGRCLWAREPLELGLDRNLVNPKSAATLTAGDLRRSLYALQFHIDKSGVAYLIRQIARNCVDGCLSV
jgi:hypothetical protein